MSSLTKSSRSLEYFFMNFLSHFRRSLHKSYEHFSRNYFGNTSRSTYGKFIQSSCESLSINMRRRILFKDFGRSGFHSEIPSSKRSFDNSSSSIFGNGFFRNSFEKSSRSSIGNLFRNPAEIFPGINSKISSGVLLGDFSRRSLGNIFRNYLENTTGFFLFLKEFF